MKMYRYLLALGLFILGSVFPLSSQTLLGNWYGLIEMPDRSTRVVLRIADSEGVYSAFVDSPDESKFNLKVDELGLYDGQLSFRLNTEDADFIGRVDGSSSYISGDVILPAGKFPLHFQRKEIEAPWGTQEWFKNRLTKYEVRIPMRDGAKLFTSYYLPKKPAGKYPILMIRTPYNSEPSEEDYNIRLLKPITHLIEAGYIIVFQDVRGRLQSEGVFENVRPHNPDKQSNADVDESTDTYDAIDWLVKNVPHNNGRVGVFGISYPGFYATMSTIDAHPALKAVSPQAPVTDWFAGDDFHHNGAFFMMDALSFFSGFGRPRPEPTRKAVWGFPWPHQDNYKFFMDLGPVRNVKERYFADSIQFWNDMMAHPNYDEFWQAHNPRPHLKNIQPAVLTVGGWFDAENCFGAQQVYKAIEAQNPDSISNRIILGPWYHGQWERGVADHLGNIHFGWDTGRDFKKLERQFFDYYLKDIGEMDLPEATIFLTGVNEWRNFDAWPPQNTIEKSLYFHPAGSLSFEAPGDSTERFEEYVSDPMKPVPYTEDVHLRRTKEFMTDDQRFAARRPDVLVFQTEVLEEDVTLTGPLQADLWVSTSGTDADYVVKLIDVFPDTLRDYPENEKGVPMAGYQMLVRGEILRGRYRNSLENPEPFTPGAVTQVGFQLPDVGHTFKKGHRIMIQVQNSWFPLVDRNPQKYVDIYHCGEEDFQKATHRVYFDAERPSRVVVSVLE